MDRDILKVIQSDQFTFHLKEFVPSHQGALEDYCKQAQAEGVINNSSLKHLKMGAWQSDKWWIVLDNNTKKIISISGCHPLFEYEKDCWRVMFRLGTLKAYRGRAGAIGKDQRSCFGWGVMLPYQIEHCRAMGAKKIVFTTNADEAGDPNSQRQDRVCRKVFEKLKMAKLIDSCYLYNTYQNVWQVLIEDVYSKKTLVL